MATTAQITGQQAENLACEYLMQQGLKLLDRNFRRAIGEIDLIMQDKAILAFIEVRYRKQAEYGDGAMTVTKGKQRKLIRTALLYLQERRLLEKSAFRFDVVTVDDPLNKQNLNWIKDAFWVEY